MSSEESRRSLVDMTSEESRRSLVDVTPDQSRRSLVDLASDQSHRTEGDTYGASEESRRSLAAEESQDQYATASSYDRDCDSRPDSVPGDE